MNNKRKAQYRNNQAYGEKKILCVRCPKKSKHISRAEIGGELLCFKHYAEALAEERVRKTGSAAFTLPKGYKHVDRDVRADDGSSDHRTYQAGRV